MAEDGEILSSPDAAEGVEITLHADTGISSDEDLNGNNIEGNSFLMSIVAGKLWFVT